MKEKDKNGGLYNSLVHTLIKELKEKNKTKQKTMIFLQSLTYSVSDTLSHRETINISVNI